MLTKLKAKVYILLQPNNFEREQKMQHLFFDICYYLQKRITLISSKFPKKKIIYTIKKYIYLIILHLKINLENF